MRPMSSKPATSAEMHSYDCAYVRRTAPSTKASASGLRSTLHRKLLPRSSMDGRLLQSFCSIERCGEDRNVARAAAQMATEIFAQLAFGWIWAFPQIAVERHQDSGGAEA